MPGLISLLFFRCVFKKEGTLKPNCTLRELLCNRRRPPAAGGWKSRGTQQPPPEHSDLASTRPP